MDSGKVLLGLLAGVAAGAILGVLFAPDKGSVTRTRIAKKGEDYADTLKEKFNDLIDGFSEDFNKVKEDIGNCSKHIHSNTEEMSNEAKAVVN